MLLTSADVNDRIILKRTGKPTNWALLKISRPALLLSLQLQWGLNFPL